LSEKSVSVAPGASESVQLTVRNTGTVVDQFTCEVLGEAAAWATVTPPVVSMFPSAEETVEITFEPPKLPTTKSGRMAFAVRAASAEDPAGSVVEEGTLEVGAFSDVVVELVPRTSRGRRKSRTQLVVDNRSNVAYRGSPTGVDPQLLLKMTFDPPVIDVAPGAVAFSRVVIRPRKTFWRGPTTNHSFQVMLTEQPAGPEPVPLAAPFVPPVAPPAPAAAPPPDVSPAAAPAAAAAAAAPAPAHAAPAPPPPAPAPPPPPPAPPPPPPAPPPPDGGAPASLADAAAGTPDATPPAGSEPHAGAPAMPPGAPGIPPPPAPPFPGDEATPPGPSVPGEGPGAMYAGGGTTTLEPPTEPESVHPMEISTDGTMVQDALIPRWLPLLLLLLLLLIILLVILWFLLVKPQINAATQNEVKKQLAAAGITPGSTQPPPTTTTTSGGSHSTGTTAPTPTTVPAANFNNSLIANGNGTTTYTVPSGKTLNITDLLVQNTAGDTGTVSLNRNATTLLSWSMANFRDLDYHWITPITFSSGQQVNLVVAGCTNTCKPGIYFAGSLG